MARKIGSLKALPSLKDRDPRKFDEISKDIEQYGRIEVAAFAGVSVPTVRNFLLGLGLSEPTELAIYKGLTEAKSAKETKTENANQQAKAAILS